MDSSQRAAGHEALRGGCDNNYPAVYGLSLFKAISVCVANVPVDQPSGTRGKGSCCAPVQNAIKTSLNYDKCLATTGDARLSCQLDKALTNVGALLATEVEGRVCTEIDPRLANDKGKPTTFCVHVIAPIGSDRSPCRTARALYTHTHSLLLLLLPGAIVQQGHLSVE